MIFFLSSFTYQWEGDNGCKFQHMFPVNSTVVVLHFCLKKLGTLAGQKLEVCQYFNIFTYTRTHFLCCVYLHFELT